MNIKQFKKMTIDEKLDLIPSLYECVLTVKNKLESTTNLNEKKEIYSLIEAAEYLGIKEKTLRSKTFKKEITYIKKGNRIYFTHYDIMYYLKSGVVKSNYQIEDDVADFFKETKKKCKTS